MAVESCGDMASLDLHEKANFTRLSRLLVDKGTEALRNTFDGIHSPANLSAVLSANQASLLKLKPRVINDSQWNLLYPPSGSPPDSKTFDVTLLTVLFRNICGLPKTGWGAVPVDSDRSMQANIVRIRMFRNEVYAHVTSTQVDNATFESLWEKIKQVLVDLKIYQEDIDELKTCPLGPREEECVGILQYWKSHEEECLIVLEGLCNDVKSMESSILNRLTEISEEKRDVQINRSREKDEDLLRKLAKHNFKSKVRSKVKFFLPGTRQWLLKKVDEWFIENEHKSKILLLTAGPGFGKTVFSSRVCEDFKNKGKLAGCHFCDFSDSNLRNPMIMLESLASQMCDNVVGFKEKLIDQLKRHHEVREDISKLWGDVLRVNTAITDELRARISWHIVEFGMVNNHCIFKDSRYYLTSVLAHSPKNCFSDNERSMAQSLLLKSPGLVNIDCNHEVEVIPLAVRADSFQDIRASGLSNDNSKAAVGEIDGTIILVDIPSLVELWQYPTDFESISCCTFSPDDSLVLFGKLETALGIANKMEVPFFPNNKENFVSCGFSPNGKRLVTSNGSNIIKLWDIAQQSLLSLLCTDIPACSCFFSSTGLFIIANRNSEMYDPHKMVTDTDGEDSFCVWNAITWQRCDERNKEEDALLGDLCKQCFPAKFELPAFKRLNVKPCEPLSSWKGKFETWSTGYFRGVMCHFALDEQSLSVVESTHFTVLACWSFSADVPVMFSNNYFRKMTTIDDDLWLYADVEKLVIFRILVRTPEQPSCLPSPELVYSSSFSPDGCRLATCSSDGFVNVWNVDTGEVDQRFECNQKDLPFACWWSEKFLFVFHVLNGVPTISKYPMDTNLKLLPFQRLPLFHFKAKFFDLPALLLQFSEGLLFFKCWKPNTVLVLDVKGIEGLQVVILPHIEPNMRIRVSHNCSFVFGSGKGMFYIWRRNVPVYSVLFKESPINRDALGDGYLRCCCFSRDSKVAVVTGPSVTRLPFYSQNFQIIDLDSGSYKILQFNCFNFSPELFCFSGVVICVGNKEIYVLDLDTGARIDYSFQRYLTYKFLRKIKLSPNKTALAIPMMNGDIKFIRLSIAQNPSLSSMRNKAATMWERLMSELK